MTTTVATLSYQEVLYHLRHDDAAGAWFFTATTPDCSRSICKALCGAASRDAAILRLKKHLGLS